MASPDVIRDMGDTLLYLLRSGLVGLVDPTRVVVGTPDEFETLGDPAQPTVTVFLYRVGVNPEMRNGPRRLLPDGRTTRPLLPLELCYLITPWARETRDEYRITGRVVQVLYDRAELGPADLQGASWEAGDTVQLILETLPMVDHYRIWDTTDLPYRLSLTYMARVIGIAPIEELTGPPVVEALIGTGSA
jgi:hypothetical protein